MFTAVDVTVEETLIDSIVKLNSSLEEDRAPALTSLNSNSSSNQQAWGSSDHPYSIFCPDSSLDQDKGNNEKCLTLELRGQIDNKVVAVASVSASELGQGRRGEVLRLPSISLRSGGDSSSSSSSSSVEIGTASIVIRRQDRS